MIRAFHPDDLPALDALRAASFAPVLAGFRAALGARVADVALAQAEAEQAALLADLAASDDHTLLVSTGADGAPTGFVALRCDRASGLGEIVLMAVAPTAQGAGLGRALTEAALERMRAVGMRAACVGTGGDAAHAPARALYSAAGFQAVIPSMTLYRAL
ncbi:MAG: GNAT family N-acetyltransferase [Rhodobacteraceae bacterium]|nr:GNAT family N-acetyltransferase [Paracoccaceae bacterium]